MSYRESALRAAGAEAREKGWGFETNPFHPDDPMFKVWLEGWGGEREDLPPEAGTGIKVILGLTVFTSMAMFFLLAILDPKG